MLYIIKRNLLVFFRDRASVFFSLLSVIIIIGLYVLFLGDVISTGMSAIPSARFLIDSWITAGVLAVASITTTMGAFGTMVDDKTNKIIKDFSSSPIKKVEMVGGYVFSSLIIGFIMSVITFILSELYIVSGGGELLPASVILKVLGITLLSVLAGSSMVFFLVTFFRSQNAFATASTIIGTLIGFLTGIYIPIGNLPESVQLVVKIFPISHAGAILRQVMMERPLQIAFENAPAEVINNFKETMGITFEFGNSTVSVASSILILVATALIFYGLAIINVSKKMK
jgi:multidrug/hemolysin transport system permease protein